MKRLHLYRGVFITVFTSVINLSAFAQECLIKGIVNDGSENIEAATVVFGNQTKLTNTKGEFSFWTNPGSYLLLITHVGYQKIKKSITIKPGDTLNFYLTLFSVENLDTVVFLGSRSAGHRSNLGMPVPIDVFSAKELQQTGQPGLISMLQYSAPSFNASRQLVFETITLRGLDPDHVLILVNGNRYHSMAWLNQGAPKGQLGRGSVGNDLSTIPFSAIEKIEILRDGASAQYGSDAIAGVINIRLKEPTRQTSINMHTGQYYKGDGKNLSFDINQGMMLNKNGFLNISAAFRFRDFTNRSGWYNGRVYTNNAALDSQLTRDRGFNRKEPAGNGDARYTGFGTLVNGGYNISNRSRFFWTGRVHFHETVLQLGYRFPKDSNQVNTALYPDGFIAKALPQTWDISATAGAKGEMRNGWRWSLSSLYGSNTVKYNVKNTNNASQYAVGKDAQTEFYGGTLFSSQYNTNVHLYRNFAGLKGIKELNIGVGAEWRLEDYQIRQGEKTSWYNYAPASGRQGGSQGFAGLHPKSAVNEYRNVAGLYSDVEVEVNNYFLFNAAVRYEYYSDFGGNLAGKLAVRHKFSDKFLLRGSISNGFRAPNLQHRYFSTTQTLFRQVGGVWVPVVSGVFRNNSDIAKAFGVPSLTAEKSINFSGGITSQLSKHINMTVDGYWIQLKNRLVLSGSFDKTNSAVAILLASLPDIDVVQFMTNAINTRTQGIDVVLNGTWNLRKATLHLTFAGNFTHTHIFGSVQTTDRLLADSLNTNTLFNREERGKIEWGQPQNKYIFSTNYSREKTGCMLRQTLFGKTATYHATNPTLDEFFSPQVLTDVSSWYQLKPWIKLTAGANNIFNVYPDPLKNYQNMAEGRMIYSNDAMPFGYNGGYYFVSISFIW